jgi:hypothetical protein
VRGGPIRVVSHSLLLLLSAAASVVLARDAPVRVELAPERFLRAGSHAAIEVIVQLPAGNDAPLLLTPSVEGEAVEVVRGRMMRPDAKPQDGDPMRLRFEVPVLAKSEGVAILRVDVTTYVCERTCQRVVLRASEVLRVRSD